MSDLNAVTLLANFVQSLAHRIRTPLSVISNDLTYLRSKFPEAAELNTLEKCKEIAELLGCYSQSLSKTNDSGPFTLNDLKALLPDWKIEFEADKLAVVPSLQAHFLVSALKLMRSIPRDLNRHAEESQASLSVQSGTAGNYRLTVQIESPVFDGLVTSKTAGMSFTALFIDSLHADSPLIPLIDALLQAAHTTAQLHLGPGLRVEMEARWTG